MSPCCPHPVERHAYNGCANCGCGVQWINHPDREKDRSEAVWLELKVQLERVTKERDELRANLRSAVDYGIDEIHLPISLMLGMEAPLQMLRHLHRAITIRPMSTAPTTGPVEEVLVATTDRAGCKGWLVAHYANGGGEEQPPFRGWFFWTGHDFCQLDERTLLGWLPLPSPSSQILRVDEPQPL